MGAVARSLVFIEQTALDGGKALFAFFGAFDDQQPQEARFGALCQPVSTSMGHSEPELPLDLDHVEARLAAAALREFGLWNELAIMPMGCRPTAFLLLLKFDLRIPRIIFLCGALDRK